MQPNLTNPGYTEMMLSYTSSISYVLTHPIILAAGKDPTYYYDVFTGLVAFVWDTNSDLTFLILLPLLVLVGEALSGAFLISAVGLLYMKKWGQRLGLIMAAILIAGGIISIPTLLLAPIGIAAIPLGIVTIVYLIKLRNKFK
jgi:hypothetical protein